MNINDEEINLRDLATEIWRSKLFILVFTFFFAMGALIFTLTLEDIYKGEVKLAPSNQNSAVGLQASGALNSIAGLAGFNLSGGGEVDETKFAVETLKSRFFLMDFIAEYNYMAEVIAAESWNPKLNKIDFDSDLYLEEEKMWVADNGYPNNGIPSLQDALEFLKDSLTVTRDMQSGFVTIKYEHVSPVFAQEVVTNLVIEINEYMKLKDQESAKKSLAFLHNQVDKTQVEEINKVLFNLIEENTKKLMFTEINEDYAFQIVDPPIIEEKKIKPSRSLICIAITFFGGLLAVGLVVLRKLI